MSSTLEEPLKYFLLLSWRHLEIGVAGGYACLGPHWVAENREFLSIHWGPPFPPHSPVLFQGACMLRLTLCNPIDCSPPDSSVHGIFQARILEWVVTAYSRGSSYPRDQTHLLHWQVDSLPLVPSGKPRPVPALVLNTHVTNTYASSP